MLHIMTSPLVYARLQAEIDEAARTGNISSPVVQESEAKQLPYLQAVILEGLRTSPPSGGLLPKVVPPEGDTINGVFVPGGTEIASNTWSVVRDRETFGQEPEIFSPERWLNVSKEQYDKMARVVDLIFGYGKFKCLGRTVAMIELNKIFVEVSETENFNSKTNWSKIILISFHQLLRNFDWTVVNPTKPWTVVCSGIILHRDFFVRVTERKVKS
jgi:cytochrome P450